MKKLLALVLALVMSMSLVTISNAAFSDADKIDHKEAVDVMNALGVINGMPDGSFNPSGNVTRAEMAKMITITKLGDVDASAFLGTATGLKDIAGHWAEGYIQYCFSQGIIAGKGNGTFAPNANVTAAEAAKMLLVAIGYDPDIQGYVGADWTLATVRDAQTKGFYADLKNLPVTKTLTRDEAAQMLWNAVQAKGVKIVKGWNSDDNKITYRYEDTDSLLVSTFNGNDSVNGILTSISYNKVKNTYTYTVNGISFTMAGDYSDLYGMDVTVLQNTKANKDEYALYIHEGSLLGECYATDLDFDKLVSDKQIEGDKVYKTSSTTLTYREFNNGAHAQDNTSLASVKLIDTTGDNKVDTLVYLPFSIDEVTYVGKDNVTTKNNSNVKLEDVTMYSGVAKNDYTKVVAAANTVKNSKTFTKLDAQSGTVDGYKTVDGTARYLVDGIWMKLAGAAVSKLSGNTAVGAAINYYAFGNVIYDLKITSGAQGLEDLVMVADYATETGVGAHVTGYKAKLVFADGTSKSAYIVDADGNVPGAAPTVGVLCTYEVNNSGNYVLTALSSGNKAGYEHAGANAATTLGDDDTLKPTSAAPSTLIKYVNDTNGGGAGVSYEIDDNAVVFWYNGTKHAVKVYSGKELKSLNVSDIYVAHSSATGTSSGKGVLAYATSKANGFESVAVVAVRQDAATWPGFTVGSTYGYLTSDAYTSYDKKAEKWYVNYTMWTANGEVTAKEEGKNLTDRVAGNVVCYNTVDANGIVKNLRVVSADLGVVTGWDGKKIAITGTTPLTTEVVSDTQVIYVNSDKKVGVEGGAITEGAIVGGGSTPNVNNVRYVKNSNKDQLDLIIVDVNNEMKAASAMSVAFANLATTLGKCDSVTVTDNATFSADMTIAEGKTVVFDGTVTVDSSKTLTINGNVTITGALTLNGNIAIGAKGSLTLVDDNTTAATLEKITASAGATLVVKEESTSNATAAAKFYKNAGAKPTNPPTNDNGTAAEVYSTSETIAAATYVYGTVYTNTTGTTASAWVKK